MQICHEHHHEASVKLRMNFKIGTICYTACDQWYFCCYYYRKLCISMKCAIRITASCCLNAPSKSELHLSVQAAPWVVSNEWWEIFPGVQCCFAGGSHRGSDDDMSCSYVKNLETPVYWQCWLEHTRAHIKLHPHVRLLNSVQYLCFLLVSHVEQPGWLSSSLFFSSSFWSVAPLWTWSFSRGSTCQHHAQRRTRLWQRKPLLHHITPSFDACILVTEINYYVHNLGLQPLFFSAQSLSVHVLDTHKPREQCSLQGYEQIAPVIPVTRNFCAHGHFWPGII